MKPVEAKMKEAFALSATDQDAANKIVVGSRHAW